MNPNKPLNKSSLKNPEAFGIILCPHLPTTTTLALNVPKPLTANINIQNLDPFIICTYFQFTHSIKLGPKTKQRRCNNSKIVNYKYSCVPTIASTFNKDFILKYCSLSVFASKRKDKDYSSKPIQLII